MTKRVSVSVNSGSTPPQSSISLRPRAAPNESIPQRRSFRIVANGNIQSTPTIIRVVRPIDSSQTSQPSASASPAMPRIGVSSSGEMYLSPNQRWQPAIADAPRQLERDNSLIDLIESSHSRFQRFENLVMNTLGGEESGRPDSARPRIAGNRNRTVLGGSVGIGPSRPIRRFIHPREFFRRPNSAANLSSVIEISSPRPDAPSSPVSISSESSEHTLSSDDIGSDESDDWEEEDLMSEASVESVDPTPAETGLLDEPAIFHFTRDHTGRTKCFRCNQRILSSNVKLDFRSGTRAAPLRHCHVDCFATASIGFTRNHRLVRFDNSIPVEEQQAITERLTRSLPLRPDGQSFIPPLYPVTRGGDAHQREVLRQRDANRYMELNRSMWTSTDRYLSNRVMFGLPFPAFVAPAPPSKGVSPEVFSSLPRVTIPAESNGENVNCIICLETMEPGKTVVMLPCFHRYHEDCIGSWFKCSKLCPMDKLDVEQLTRDGGSSQSVPRTFIT
jgi:hypothetical protein